MFSLTTTRILRQLSPKWVNYSTKPSCQEIRIPVPWGYLAGKWWGPTDQRPILTLHGWQDNCGSFNRLIPLLNQNVGFLAIDFPGHGHSTHIPDGFYYHFSDYLLVVQYLIKYFEWPKISFMGHSMGAITSYTFNLLYPNKVDFVVCIDAMKPMIARDNIPRIAKDINQFFKLQDYQKHSTEPPSYSMEEILKKTRAPNKNSIELKYCHHIADRNTAPSKIHPGKYYFSRDQRLKVGEMHTWSQSDLVKSSEHVKNPVFVGKAIDSTYYEEKEYFYEVLDVLKRTSVDCQYHRFEGTHHYHLNNPKLLAEKINQFIEKHDVEDRTVGPIKEEMKLKS